MKTQFGRVVVCTLYNEKSVIQCFCLVSLYMFLGCYVMQRIRVWMTI
jgi:hypothetical protein